MPPKAKQQVIEYDPEYYETLVKSIQEKYVDGQFNVSPSEFEILSTMRYDPNLTVMPPLEAEYITKDNIFLFDEHYHRLTFTLQYFQLHMNGTSFDYDIPYDFLLKKIIDGIKMSKKNVYEAMKVRLLVSLNGELRIELQSTPYRANLLDGLSDFPDEQMWNVYIDRESTLISPFTSFKTTNRLHYTDARERCLPGLIPGREEVLLVNAQGNVMEGSITNIAVRRKSDSKWITPQLSCGCLCGVMRHFLLRMDFLEEETIPLQDVEVGDDILLFNGVMGVVKGKIVG